MLIEYTVSYLQVNLNHITTIQWGSLDVLDKRPVNKNFIVHVSVLSIFRLREWRGFHITKQITSELSHVMPADLYTHHTTPTPTQHMKWGGGGGGMGMLCIWMHVTVTTWYVFFITVYSSRYFTVPHDEYVNSAHIVSHHTHDKSSCFNKLKFTILNVSNDFTES